MVNDSDKLFLKRCYDLAIRGEGSVSPNPMVGAVVVYDNRIIGEGFHQTYGGPHAEVQAINSIKAADQSHLPSSTLYVSLEPCNIESKTPACTDLIKKHRIKRVVIGSIDPNPRIHGNGIKSLEASGIEVDIHESDSFKIMNKTFWINQNLSRSFVMLKFAESNDGFIGKQDQRIQLSGNISNRMVHEWRKNVDAILIGSKTAIVDNPKLTTRLVPGKNPIRILIDLNNKCPNTLNIWKQDAPTWLITSSKRSDISSTVKQIIWEKYPVDPKELTKHLFTEGIGIIMVEGGASTLDIFKQNDCWDEARVITSSKPLVKGIPSPIMHTPVFNMYMIENDLHRTYYRPASLKVWT